MMSMTSAATNAARRLSIVPPAPRPERNDREASLDQVRRALRKQRSAVRADRFAYLKKVYD